MIQEGRSGVFPLSVLDVVPVGTGSTGPEALQQSVILARRAEQLGFTRYWFAEHHGMPSIASSSPEILIAHIAANTHSIRVGSGGIMLQNHVPLKAAESFHTLHALHPGRIDMGIGRAPGTDPTTSQAMRPFDPSRFSEQMAELIGLSRGTLPPDHPFHTVRVIPSEVSLPPIWILGSSGASARFAGEMEMGYSFARHFSPTPPGPAFAAYRDAFRPSDDFPEPHIILGVSVVCAETQDEAEYLAASSDLMWVQLRKGQYRPIPTPEEALAYPYTGQDRAIIEHYRGLVIVGDPQKVRAEIDQLVADTGASEVIVTSNIHSPEARVRSFELLAAEFGLEARSGDPE